MCDYVLIFSVASSEYISKWYGLNLIAAIPILIGIAVGALSRRHRRFLALSLIFLAVYCWSLAGRREELEQRRAHQLILSQGKYEFVQGIAWQNGKSCRPEVLEIGDRVFTYRIGDLGYTDSPCVGGPNLTNLCLRAAVYKNTILALEQVRGEDCCQK